MFLHIGVASFFALGSSNSFAHVNLDLAGPAELTRVSGVNGADLLQLSINELSHDIRLTPFAARKVGAARDEFLRGL